MSDRIFDQPWFTHAAFAGVRNTLHANGDAALANEDQLVAKLALHLLDRERAQGAQHRHHEVLSFMAFCQQSLAKSQSQILQDLWVLYMTQNACDGYFVEFGACDGKKLSNTHLLETEFGWSGILAEPNPVWHAPLSQTRSCVISHLCVAARSGEQVAFLSADSMPELSRLRDIIPDDTHERDGNRQDHTEIAVETVSLTDLLARNDAPQVIDYLSVDTEGSEFEILNAHDFDAYRFRLITVEHAGETEKREAIKALLEKHGYRQWHPALTRWDDWYVGPDGPLA